MPLRDHFHPPLSDFCPWVSFHGNWATKIVHRLNAERRSEKYKALAARHFGAQIATDISALKRSPSFELSNGHDGGAGTTSEGYSPPATALSRSKSIAVRAGGNWWPRWNS